jgi:hypothetical protein
MKINIRSAMKFHLFATFFSLTFGNSRIGKFLNYNVIQKNDVCYGIVNYPFYFTRNDTLYSKNAEMLSYFASDFIRHLPESCPSALLKLLCSSTYPMCITGVDIHNESTWSDAIYSEVGEYYPLPYTRPCMSLCDDAMSQCFGNANVFGISTNCNATEAYGRDIYDVSKVLVYPRKYDRNNGGECNSMTSMIVRVEGVREEYAVKSGRGVCSEVLKELYIPRSSTISPQLSPFQQPYAIQNILENQVEQLLNSLPPWLTTECYYSLKTFVCLSKMIRPVKQSMREVFGYNNVSDKVVQQLQVLGIDMKAFLDYNVSLPSYLSTSVCLDYTAKCADFMPFVRSTPLDAHCDDTTKFSSLSQTVLSTVLKGVNQKLDFRSYPYNATVLHGGYEPKCPSGFVIPEDADDPNVIHVDGSACAVQCMYV